MLKWLHRVLGVKSTQVFERLTPLLVDAIPRAISANKLPLPLCSVRVYYFDTCAPCTYLTLRTMSAGYRARLVARCGRDVPYSLWSSGEEECDGDIDLGLPDGVETDDEFQLVRLFSRVYSRLSGDYGDRDFYMTEFRQMLQRVCRELNARDWREHCEVTDDFVIAPADGSQHYGGDEDYNDLVNSISGDRLNLLRSRGWLGPEDEWSRLASDR